MLNIITNILLTVMLVLPSSNVPVTNLEQNQITAQQLKKLLNDTAEIETKNSFLNKEFSDDLASDLEQESLELNKVALSTETSAVEKMIDTSSLSFEDAIKKEVAFSNLKDAISQIQTENAEDVSNLAFMLNNLSDEMVKAMPLSTNTDGISETGIVEETSEVEEETTTVFKDYRQTFYSVTAGEVKVGYGLTYQDDSVKVIDNVMHYYDDEYEWIPIVAVNIDEVLEVGLNERGVPNYYGTILEITYPEGDSQKAIVLDACGACSWDNRIDLWVYDYNYQHDIKGIEYRIIREGFKDEDTQ